MKCPECGREMTWGRCPICGNEQEDGCAGYCSECPICGVPFEPFCDYCEYIRPLLRREPARGGAGEKKKSE